MAYNIVKIKGLEDQELFVHMCHPFSATQDMVEFHTLGGTCVVLTREQFEGMVKWVTGQFAELARHVPVIN